MVWYIVFQAIAVYGDFGVVVFSVVFCYYLCHFLGASAAFFYCLRLTSCGVCLMREVFADEFNKYFAYVCFYVLVV